MFDTDYQTSRATIDLIKSSSQGNHNEPVYPLQELTARMTFPSE